LPNSTDLSPLPHNHHEDKMQLSSFFNTEQLLIHVMIENPKC
jgi:hypothetical protein